ncbi:hypothetical protein GIB67_028965 [Kingdonia uniflora]|uniref:Ninja-family protein n=1 Tax=Kingdonia uniflora TaxID=39325 RepID=A0A7J7LC95_9MAGN|nr:hypothetical protein GIB67_028965 [Kingdonia uniflora]
MKNPHFSHNGVLSALGGYDFDGNGGESSGGSSSGISDNRNASQDGENCNEIRSHSSHSPVELPKPDYVVGNSMQEKSDHSTTTPQYPTESPKSFEPHTNNSTAVTAFSGTPNGEEPITSHPTNKLISVGEESSRHSCGNTINKPPHPNTSPQTRLSQIQSIMKMPCVSTKGDGPNGKTVSGFLHNFTKTDQVTIICVCHGSSFSPAEFVKHAGGTDVSNPLKHIVVNPTSSLR